MFYSTDYRLEDEAPSPYWDVFTSKERPAPSRHPSRYAAEFIDAHPDATEDEAAQLAELEAWLVEHYEAGAHWALETMEREQLLLGLRQLGPAKLRADLKRFWKLQNERERACW